jgi:hypothetical protein
MLQNRFVSGSFFSLVFTQLGKRLTYFVLYCGFEQLHTVSELYTISKLHQTRAVILWTEALVHELIFVI